MSNDKHLKILTFALCFIIVGIVFQPLTAQDGAGGTSSLLIDGGVGARAISLGKAFVAVSDDPTAVYWNPGALALLEKQSVSFFYSGLNFGASYGFVGFVYPTLNKGALGFGWTRLGTDGIQEYAKEAAIPLGGLQSGGIDEFYFSYASSITNTLSLGGSVKLFRQDIGVQQLSDTGFGVDLGAIYRPVFDIEILRDIAFGVNIQNIISPRIKLIERTKANSINLKIGLAKILPFGEDGNGVRLSLDLNKGDAVGVSTTYHGGLEYIFQGKAGIRLGYNDGQMAYGGGAKYRNFYLDYNFGSFFDSQDFNPSHHLSVTIDFGKSRSDRIRFAREKRERDLQIRVENELWFNGETEFNNNMEGGRDKYESADYLQAYVDFTNALEAAESMHEIAMRLSGNSVEDVDATIRVQAANDAMTNAKKFQKLANEHSEAEQEKNMKRIILEARESTRESELQMFVFDHKEKGVAFFKGQNYGVAIREWRLALERINSVKFENAPGWLADVKSQLMSDIVTAEKQLQGNIKQAMRKAESLYKQGRRVQALRILDELLSRVSASESKEVERRIQRYQSELNFDQKFAEGMKHYQEKKWKEAVAAFKDALTDRPKDDKAKEYYDDAYARSKATIQQMSQELRLKYSRGVAFYAEGKYQKALDVWNSLREEQPYNMTILESIDRAKAKMN